jgi:RNA polymerase sigma-70 factor (ECF subfamily)
MHPRDLPDDELVARVATTSGTEREALVDALFSRHYERVARWCFRFTNDREAAADLAQEVFLKAHRHLADFRGTSRFTTWLYTIVRHESLNRLRKAAPVMESADVLDELPSDDDPHDAAERHHTAERLRELLSDVLDHVERLVFTLHYGDDMPLDSITRLLRLQNASGAKAYIVSARRKLARARQRIAAKGQEL